MSDNFMKNFNFCCSSEFSPDRCPVHKNQKVKFMCTHSKCHQILCTDCLSVHQKLHKKNALSDMVLSPLSDISRIYTKVNIEKQLEEIKNRRKNCHQKPQQLVTGYIEQVLYGTSQRRQKQLQSSLQQMNYNYSTGLLIKLMQDDNEYSVKGNQYSEFAQKYFQFLDRLMEDIENGRFQ